MKNVSLVLLKVISKTGFHCKPRKKLHATSTRKNLTSICFQLIENFDYTYQRKRENIFVKVFFKKDSLQ